MDESLSVKLCVLGIVAELFGSYGKVDGMLGCLGGTLIALHKTHIATTTSIVLL
jgi:hypothetical protein